MSGINPIQGARPAMISPQAPAVAPQQGGATKVSFGQTLAEAIGQIDGSQQAAESSVGDMLAGRTQDIAPMVAAAAKADLSFKLLIGVRNKVIEAYKQTLNMQV